jgi:hypothetical protein
LIDVVILNTFEQFESQDCEPEELTESLNEVTEEVYEQYDEQEEEYQQEDNNELSEDVSAEGNFAEGNDLPGTFDDDLIAEDIVATDRLQTEKSAEIFQDAIVDENADNLDLIDDGIPSGNCSQSVDNDDLIEYEEEIETLDSNSGEIVQEMVVRPKTFPEQNLNAQVLTPKTYSEPISEDVYIENIQPEVNSLAVAGEKDTQEDYLELNDFAGGSENDRANRSSEHVEKRELDSSPSGNLVLITGPVKRIKV